MRGAIVAAICAVMIGAPFLMGGQQLWAKLPAPPPMTEEQKAAKAAKAAEAAKKEAEALGKAQDRVAEKYKKSLAMKPKPGATMAAPAAKK
jgi:hypothetical protein